jgi:hypothetical protein
MESLLSGYSQKKERREKNRRRRRRREGRKVMKERISCMSCLKTRTTHNRLCQNNDLHKGHCTLTQKNTSSGASAHQLFTEPGLVQPVIDPYNQDCYFKISYVILLHSPLKIIILSQSL